MLWGFPLSFEIRLDDEIAASMVATLFPSAMFMSAANSNGSRRNSAVSGCGFEPSSRGGGFCSPCGQSQHNSATCQAMHAQGGPEGVSAHGASVLDGLLLALSASAHAAFWVVCCPAEPGQEGARMCDKFGSFVYGLTAIKCRYSGLLRVLSLM